MGRIIYFYNINWPAVARKLQRARMKWVSLYCLLCLYVEDTRSSGRFYVEVIQSLMIFGLDFWVVLT